MAIPTLNSAVASMNKEFCSLILTDYTPKPLGLGLCGGMNTNTFGMWALYCPAIVRIGNQMVLIVVAHCESPFVGQFFEAAGSRFSIIHNPNSFMYFAIWD